MHDYIIAALILIIVIIQFKVANTTSKKIGLFKNIIPDEYNLKTVKVYIPEDLIKTITATELLKNSDNYAAVPPPLMNEFDVKTINNKKTIAKDKSKTTSNNNEDLIYNEELDFNSYDKISKLLDEIEGDFIWVRKESLEEKISKNQIYQYLDNGWSLFKEDN